MKYASQKNQTVYVAMSGGVDSSVAAALLKQQAKASDYERITGRPAPKGFRGFNVVGVFMKPPSYARGYGGRSGKFCNWQKEREDAMRVASLLKIPLLTWDFSREYGAKVTRYMIEAYRKGITPNPDVMCNKEIKFGLFFKRALKEGADYIATGHYARLRRNDQIRISNFESIPNSKIKNSNIHSKLKIRNSKFSLWKAKDKNKDQSYFLWTLKQKHLEKCLFPIGEYTKPQVRKLAKKFGLPVHDKKDSQGICFIGELDMKSFLKQHIKSKSGDIVHIDGRKLGRHDGIFYYTIGQRHGLNITAGKGPFYVISKNIADNILIVGSKRDLGQTKIRVKKINIAENLDFPADIEVKIRYRASSQKATLQKDGSLVFKKSQRAIAPGQSAVFYHGQYLLGGGIIK